ncbi:cytochrome c oxidase subunit 7B, mitochondrial-like [Pipistrellus kuhlii]|uniref:cytochrome c oxidase subunit 7B, mitochondrial-like n=1 Tax=Pipistrellus kuhlii TaxID=59472 RepID=UPI00174EF48E|nr:cytochrome c oxidase subunit 7B, mitochondrial-like [Pipistrellus kuhlii]
MVFPLAKNTLSCLPVQSSQHTNGKKRTPESHDKHGNAILASGAPFCVATRTYTATRIGIEWNLSPVGRVHPKGMERLVILPVLNYFKTNS